MADENLDDVISDLIDEDAEEDTATTEPAEQQKPQFDITDMVDPAEPTEDVQTVSLTDRAAKQVARIKEDEELEDELFLRVAVEGGGCSGLSYKLGFDYRTDDDDVVESNGVEILVDKRHKMYLEGIEIDYPDGLDARGFTFDNPNANETCGCGASFAT